MIAESSGEILRNMAVYQPSFAKANLGIGLAESSFPFAEGFYLRAHQDQAGFQAIQKMVVVGRLAILRNNLNALVLRFIGL